MDMRPKAWPAWPFLAFLIGPWGTSFAPQGSQESAAAVAFAPSTAWVDWWFGSIFPLTYNLVVPHFPPTTSQMKSRPLPPSLRSRRRSWWSPEWCQKRRSREKLPSWPSMLMWQMKRNILSGVSAPFPKAQVKSLCWFSLNSGKLLVPLYSFIIKKKNYLFLWLHQVLVAACGICLVALQTLSYSMWDLVPWPGIEPQPPALETQNVSHWATREVHPPPPPHQSLIFSSKMAEIVALCGHEEWCWNDWYWTIAMYMFLKTSVWNK